MARTPLRLVTVALVAMCALTAGSASLTQPVDVELLLAPGVSFPNQSRQDRSLALQRFESRLASEGRIRVIVGVHPGRVKADKPIDPANPLNELTARADIRSAREGVLQRVASLVEPIREFETIPYMSMWIGRAAFDALLADPDVSSIQEVFVVRPTLAQSVPLVQADQAWAQGFTGAGHTVAVLDTGVDKAHPTFGSRVVSEACYSGSGSSSLCPGGASSSTAVGSGVPCTVSSDCAHGTHVAGIAAGANGVAKSSSIIAIQVFQHSNSDLGASSDDVIAGLERVYALRNTYQIASANLSLGGGAFSSTCDSDSPSMTAIVNNLRAANIATVVATGNDGFTNAVGWPACISTAISVGNTTKTDVVRSSSNAADFVSLLAPGTSITSAIPGGGTASFTGTSMAAPHVAGAWAILKHKSPNAGVGALLTALQCTGLNIVDTRNGLTFKRIRINNAMGPSICVTSPNGGETWGIGTAHPITWTASNLNQAGQVSVLLSQDGGQTQNAQAIATLSPATTSYTWTPSSAHATTAGRVFVGNLVNGSYEAQDSSDQNFTVGAATTSAPSVSTTAATSITQTGVSLNAAVNPNGFSTTLFFDYGTTASYGSTVTFGGVGSGTSAVNRSQIVAGLTCATTYHYRARAQSSGGSTDGANVTFTTSACPQSSGAESITNGSFAAGATGWVTSGLFFADSRFSSCGSCPGYAYASNADGTGANNLVGSLYQTVTIPSDAATANLTFSYYITTQETTSSVAFDVLNVTVQSTSGASLGSVVALSNTHRNTGYQQYAASLLAYKGQTVRLHFRATSDSSLPTVFRVDDVSLSVTVAGQPPSVSTGPASSISATGATVAANVNPNGAATSLYFDYGVSSSYGTTVAYGSVGSGTASVSHAATLSNLTCATTYRYRARAENTGGSANGGEQTFTTSACLPPTITSHPTGQTIPVDETTTLAVAATGPPVITYQWFRGTSGNTANAVAGATSSSFTAPASTTAASYWVRVSNPHGHADSNTADITVYQPFTDRNLVAGGSLLRAVHVLELRARIDALRARFKLDATTWTDASLSGQFARAVHIVEMRTALEGVYTAAGRTPFSFADPTIGSASPIRAVHIEDLRTAVIAIELLR